MLPKAGFKGTNVTLPHKEQALRIADEVSSLAQRIGAANTITFLDDGRIHADNTDGYGFLENLRSGAPGWVPEAGVSIVLGAGGASRAVLVALLDAGVPSILLANRTRARAEALKNEFGQCIDVVDWGDIPDCLPEAGLVVNTTSLGMSGSPPLNVSLNGLNPETVVTDLVYTPLKTGLLNEAEAMGCVTVDGLGMLLHQGVPGFERWFGKKPDVTADVRRTILS